ncbi:hypothetical protein [Marispirochaeta sp.]|uniref:hypothetical protein n=1 Tax=Marispirochaeta sp. TaxID=2038653 RepID=UPI002D1E3D74|nr:hypothetical protein [Marispirochaeta sp.]
MEAAQEELRIIQNLFTSGSASLNDLNDAEDELREAEADMLSGTLVQRLRRLELAFFAGLNQAREEPLEAPAAEFSELPKTPDLTAMALQRSPVLQSQRDQINALLRELTAGDECRPDYSDKQRQWYHCSKRGCFQFAGKVLPGCL